MQAAQGQGEVVMPMSESDHATQSGAFTGIVILLVSILYFAVAANLGFIWSGVVTAVITVFVFWAGSDATKFFHEHYRGKEK